MAGKSPESLVNELRSELLAAVQLIRDLSEHVDAIEIQIAPLLTQWQSGHLTASRLSHPVLHGTPLNPEG